MNLKVYVALLAFLTAFPQLSLADNPTANPAAARVTAQYASRPLSFEPAAISGHYLARSSSSNILISASESFVAVADSQAGSTKVLRFAFDKVNPAARIEALDLLPGVSNYYVGRDQRNWRLGVRNFARLRTKGVYPGVDVVYYGDQRRLEFDFVIAPMADAGAIALSVSGMDKLSIAADGDLVAEVNGREVRFAKLSAYQLVAGEKRPVSVEYVLAAKDKAQLRLGNYDKSQELVIDPVLSYSTYLGGSQGDTANGIAVDAAENAYITGQTCSSDFTIPTGTNPSGTAFVGALGSCNAYVTKLNPAGTTVLFTTFIAGDMLSATPSPQPAIASATGNGITLDNLAYNPDPIGQGGVHYSLTPGGVRPNVYIVGTTNYRNLPSVIPYAGGDSDAFVAILDSMNGTLVSIPLGGGGNRILLTYLGGALADIGNAIAVDTYQNVTVAGQTQSSDFPVYNGFQPKTEEYVAFATKLDFGLHIPAVDTGGPTGCTNRTMICPGSSAMTPRPWSNTDTCASSSACPASPDPANPYYFYSVMFGGQLVPPMPTWPVAGGAYISGYPVPPNAITAGTPSGTGNLVSCPGNTTPQVLVSESAPDTNPFTGAAQPYQKSGYLNWATICSSIYVNSRVADCTQLNTANNPPTCDDGAGHSTFSFNWRILGPLVGPAYATTKAYGVALDPGGDAFVVGGSSTASLEPANIYWLPGMHYAGTGAWIFKLLGNDTSSNLAGTGTKDAGAPVYLTPLGTNPADLTETVNAARAIAVDTQGRAYVVGTATGGIYTTSNSVYPTAIGGEDAFILRMNTAGSGIEYSTYLGGTGNDQGLAVAVDAGGWAYVAGSTQSNSISLLNPIYYGTSCLSGGACVTLNQLTGTQDAFLTKVSTEGSSLIMSAYLGGAGIDSANGVALANSGGGIFDIFLVGNTTSTDFPNVSSVQATNKGNGDAFVTKINGQSFPMLTVTSADPLTFTTSVAVGWSSAVQPITVQASQATVHFTSITATGDFSQTNTCGTPPNAQLAPGISCTINVIFTPTATGTRNGVLTIHDDATNSPQTVGLVGTGTLVQDTVAPPSLNLGTMNVGSTSTAQNVTVTNNDPNWSLIMSSVVATTTGITTGTGDFNVSSNTCTSLLAHGQQCTIGVTFTPTTAGSRLGTLVINGNGNDFPFTVSLSGTGNGTGTSPTGTTPDFTMTGPASQPVTRGTPATFPISLAAIAGFSQSVSLSCTGTGTITCSVSPVQVTVSGTTSQPATVTVNVPAGGGIVIGSLRRPGRLLAVLLPFGMFGLVLSGRRRSWLVLLLLLVFMGVGLIGCGGGGGSSNSGQPQSITITGTPNGGATAHSVTIPLTIS